MMVKSKIYKGIEYVQLSELPQEQRDMLSNTLNKNLIIKILVSGKIQNDCLQFRDYLTWYEGIYKVQPSSVKIESAKQGIQDLSETLITEDN